MKISELLEQHTPEKTDANPEPVTIGYTDRFIRDFKSFSKLPNFKDEFENFLDAKLANPQATFGQKDAAFIATRRKGLKNWWHAHIVYGKAIVTYRFVGTKLILAAVTDHLSVECDGPRIQSFENYLDSVDLGLDYKAQEKKKKTTSINTVAISSLEKTLGLDAEEDQSLQLAQQAVKKSVLSLFYEMAAVSQDRALLDSLVKDDDTSVLFFFDVMSPPIPRDAVSMDDLKLLAKSALALIPG